MGYTTIAILMFATMMLMLVTGQRVFAAIGFICSIFALSLWGTGGVEIPFSASINLLGWNPLLTLPMFIFLGYMLSESGLANDLYEMFYVWMGPLRGGLAAGTIVIMVIVSALNGLSVAGMAVGNSIALPELLRRNYDKRMVTGVIQAGSTIGLMIPPSIVLVLYGVIARVPVGQLWVAGILPGLMLICMFIGYVLIRSWINPELAPAMTQEERANTTWAHRFRMLRAGVVPLVILFLMTGLFLMGITSLVEMAAVGAVSTTVAAALKRRLTPVVIRRTVRKTLSVTCMFMWIILAALAFGAVFDGLGATKALEFFLRDELGLSPFTIIVIMQISFLIMGMFLDDTAMLILVAPLYIPIVRSLGFSPVWFGVLYALTTQVAYMTPPFGYNLFLMRAMAPPEITLADIYRSIIPFALLLMAGLGILMVFPQLSLWLPGLVYGV